MRELLQGKNVAVVGASSGIGLSIAQFAAEQGANLVIGARRVDKLNESIATLRGEGDFFAQSVDVTREEQVKSFIDFCSDKLGPLDGVVYCAGVHAFVPISLSSEGDFSHFFDTNVRGAQFLIKYATKRKASNKMGMSIVLLSSSAASKGSGAASLYSASKGALESMTRSLAIEFAKRKIRFNAVAPGMVSTEMTSDMKQTLGTDSFQNIISQHPLGIGAPDDVAHGVGFLLSDYSKWITGSVIPIDGGFSS
ncbi:SDR family NAD(P)-dependent oxidoreductase [Vibrio hangzhouensis]|uniref:SDR family NAD(P)-dependent oxidoreductase n=1 Tax=Vibrio hangzhouensis TaxID=462991 RepID=UPI001C97A5CD|nr:SDR family oxidoreductase [Vibrio hangzhouensis]MBY6198456.1 SDR family oxidoreductase [Vibrio hangzhouensis]